MYLLYSRILIYESWLALLYVLAECCTTNVGFKNPKPARIIVGLIELALRTIDEERYIVFNFCEKKKNLKIDEVILIGIPASVL